MVSGSILPAPQRPAAVAKSKARTGSLENVRRVLTEDDSRFGYERTYFFQVTPSEEGWGLLSFPDWEPRPAYEWLSDRAVN